MEVSGQPVVAAGDASAVAEAANGLLDAPTRATVPLIMADRALSGAAPMGSRREASAARTSRLKASAP